MKQRNGKQKVVIINNNFIEHISQLFLIYHRKFPSFRYSPEQIKSVKRFIFYGHSLNYGTLSEKQLRLLFCNNFYLENQICSKVINQKYLE